jgi:hypothetical protein
VELGMQLEAMRLPDDFDMTAQQLRIRQRREEILEARRGQSLISTMAPSSWPFDRDGGPDRETIKQPDIDFDRDEAETKHEADGSSAAMEEEEQHWQKENNTMSKSLVTVSATDKFFENFYDPKAQQSMVCALYLGFIIRHYLISLPTIIYPL